MTDEMKITLRQAETHDAAAIARIHIVSKRETMPYLPELHTEEDTRSWVSEGVLPNQDVWVAERAGRPVGVAALDGEVLEQLYVLPEDQGCGVGSMLLQKAFELADGPIMLWTFQRNTAARAFYERRGFVAVEFTNGADNEEHEPDVRYQLLEVDQTEGSDQG